MELTAALEGGAATLCYLERYVNDGSPSGFTELHTTSAGTCPTGDEPWFDVVATSARELASDVWTAGASPYWHEPRTLLVHPDMVKQAGLEGLVDGAHRATPTASARTVRKLDHDQSYLKLTYKGLIGRVERQLGRAQSESALEVSSAIESLLRSGELGSKCALLREKYAEVWTIDGYEWGFIVRESNPYPEARAAAALFPAFSLFSRDRCKIEDDPLLAQLVKSSGRDPLDVLVDDLVGPLLDAYFGIVLKAGLQIEPHAQNILFEVSPGSAKPLRVVIRDAESVDKDVPLLAGLGRLSDFSNNGYKFLRASDYNYQIMHSFMFDFKMGQYLLHPLISCLEPLGLSRARATDAIRDISRSWIDQLPTDFLPHGAWYRYDNIIHDRSARRPYIRVDAPEFR